MPAPSPNTAGVKPSSWFICRAAMPTLLRSRYAKMYPRDSNGRIRRRTRRMVASSIVGSHMVGGNGGLSDNGLVVRQSAIRRASNPHAARCAFYLYSSILESMSTMIEGTVIRADDLAGEATRALLRLHLQGMRAQSPPGSVFALDYSGLTGADVKLWTAWVGEEIAGMAELRDLGEASGEVKSMRTHPKFLRRGIAAALLEHIIDSARAGPA